MSTQHTINNPKDEPPARTDRIGGRPLRPQAVDIARFAPGKRTDRFV